MVKKKKKMFTHIHLHPPLLKKNTRFHGSAFCCDIFFFFFFLICQHELGFQLQMALGDQIHHALLSPFAPALDFFFKSRFIFTKAPLHGLECLALFSVTVCGCVQD